MAETINALYKAEAIHQQGGGFATLEWVDWFNRRRLREPIGNIHLAEAEQRHYAALDDVPMSA